MSAAAAASAAPPAAILCVDDEPNILASLQRLFRKNNFRVLCADGAAAGLAVLEQETIDVVMSDMRMPQCSGADFPERVRERDIPVGARILAVAYDFEALQSGQLVQRQVDGRQAAGLLAESRGKRYDPDVIEAFYDVRTGRHVTDEVSDIVIGVRQLRPGMTLGRDLVSEDGALLLSADHVLNERLLKQLADFERRSGTTLQLYIKTGAS